MITSTVTCINKELERPFVTRRRSLQTTKTSFGAVHRTVEEEFDELVKDIDLDF